MGVGLPASGRGGVDRGRTPGVGLAAMGGTPSCPVRWAPGGDWAAAVAVGRKLSLPAQLGGIRQPRTRRSALSASKEHRAFHAASPAFCLCRDAACMPLAAPAGATAMNRTPRTCRPRQMGRANWRHVNIMQSILYSPEGGQDVEWADDRIIGGMFAPTATIFSGAVGDLSSSPLSQPHVHIGINAHLLATTAGYLVARGSPVHLSDGTSPARHRKTCYTRFIRGSPRAGSLALIRAWPARDCPPAAERRALPGSRLCGLLQARRDRLTLMHSMAFATPRLAPCPGGGHHLRSQLYREPGGFSGGSASLPDGRGGVFLPARGPTCRHLRFRPPRHSSSLRRAAGANRRRAARRRRHRPFAGRAGWRRSGNTGLPDQFILHVGALQPRRTYHVCSTPFARLGRRPELSFVLVGGRGGSSILSMSGSKRWDYPTALRFARLCRR